VFSAVMRVAANDCFLFLAVQVSDRLRPLFYGGSFFLLVLNRQDLSSRPFIRLRILGCSFDLSA
jgi:hypothetical protein